MRGTISRLRPAAVVLCLATWSSGRASAALLSLHLSGAFAPSSGLLPTPVFTTPVAFSVSALFNPTPSFSDGSDYAYLTQATFNISGFGAFITAPGSLAVLLGGPFLNGSDYEVGLISTSNTAFVEGYVLATPPLDVLSVTPTVFSEGVGVVSSFFPMEVYLNNGYSLIITGFEGPLSASISVPEPAAIVVLGFGLAGLVFVRRPGVRS
jgi:hypothetical protein